MQTSYEKPSRLAADCCGSVIVVTSHACRLFSLVDTVSIDIVQWLEGILRHRVIRSHVRYIGQYVCNGRHSRRSFDLDHREREAIVFERTPIDRFIQDEQRPAVESRLNELTLEGLEIIARADSAESRAAIARVSLVRYGSAAVRRYVMRRADGRCEGCEEPAAFVTISGEPSLEAHHIRRLSDGGPDNPRWVAGVFANCHRRAHHAADRISFNQHLADKIGTKSTNPDS